jgi:hypothetical protein
MCKWQALCYYYKGGGVDLDLSSTGLVQDITTRWQTKQLANIQNYVGCGGAAGKTWDIDERPSPLACDYWIGNSP